MTKLDWDRWAPLSGLVFVGLVIATFFTPTADLPDSDDPAAKVVSFFADHRTALLTGGYLAGLAIVFFLWFLGSLAARLRDGGEQRLAAVAFGGGLLLAGYALFTISVQTILAFRLASEVDAGIAKALYELQLIRFAFAFPLFVLAAATSIAALRSRIFPQWYGALGLVAALWFVVSGAAYYKNGFFSPDGGYGFVGFLAFLVWVLVTSVLLVRRKPAEATRAAAVTAS